MNLNAQDTVDRWNEFQPVGTVVRYWPMSRKDHGLVSSTTGPAWLLGDTPVVNVLGCAGPIALTHVEPVEVRHSLPPALTVHCRVCDRAPGLWCVSELGGLRAWLHDEREHDAKYPEKT